MQAEYDGSNDGSTTEDEIDHPERQTEGDGFNDEFDDDAKYYCVVSTAPAEKQWCGSNVISPATPRLPVLAQCRCYG